MTTVGVICEYNPFHNGHLRQLSEIRAHYGADSAIVCLMSGNYVQRGAPAVFDKHTRAKAAALCGADLVLELPLTYALRSAEGFADGGVSILTKLGCGALCFGSESGDGNKLMSTAKLLLSPDFDRLLLPQLKTGVSYPMARQLALLKLGGAELTQPNDILAVEYCKAILRQNSPLDCFALQREGDYHASELNPASPSAERIRALLDEPAAWRPSVPEKLLSLYESAPRYTLRAGERAILARVRTLSDEDFAALPFGAEGLWRRLMRACRSCGSAEEIIEQTKTKRYTRTRIQRMLLCAYLGLTQADLEREAPHVRVLAFSPRGAMLLRALRGTVYDSRTGDGSPSDVPPRTGDGSLSDVPPCANRETLPKYTEQRTIKGTGDGSLSGVPPCANRETLPKYTVQRTIAQQEGTENRPLSEEWTQNRPLSRLALINSGQTPLDKKYYSLECRAADLYALFCEDAKQLSPGMEQAARNYYICNPGQGTVNAKINSPR